MVKTFLHSFLAVDQRDVSMTSLSCVAQWGGVYSPIWGWPKSLSNHSWSDPRPLLARLARCEKALRTSTPVALNRWRRLARWSFKAAVAVAPWEPLDSEGEMERMKHDKAWHNATKILCMWLYVICIYNIHYMYTLIYIYVLVYTFYTLQCCQTLLVSEFKGSQGNVWGRFLVFPCVDWCHVMVRFRSDAWDGSRNCILVIGVNFG